MGKAWIQGPLEHGTEIGSIFKSNEVTKIKSNRKSRNKSEKFSKKESSEIQGVTGLLPLLTRFGFGVINEGGYLLFRFHLYSTNNKQISKVNTMHNHMVEG